MNKTIYEITHSEEEGNAISVVNTLKGLVNQISQEEYMRN